MTITKNAWGYLVISDILNGYRVQQTYVGYTKKEAISLFKKFKEKK